MELTFFGAADTVTGSRFLVESGDARVLVDCGLFQGIKALRERNWAPFPVRPDTLDAVVLTHAHIDHSGMVPALVRDGFAGPVYCSSATADLLGVMWPDAAYLQEEEARYRNRKRTTRHAPALPLYTRDDAQRALTLLRPVPWGSELEVAEGMRALLTPVGHILGASSVRLDDGRVRVAFSGDVGRSDDHMLHPPEPLPPADVLVVESTYGNRLHPGSDPEEALGAIVRRTVERGGIVLVPAFAVGRAQLVLHLLARLRERGELPDVPVFLNSPMAIDATEIFYAHPEAHRLAPEQVAAMGRLARLTPSMEESKALSQRRAPAVIVSASGMATGGRVLHHLKALLGNPRNTVLFCGYQAAGTRGEALLAGVDRIKIHGMYHDVQADVCRLDALSAHGDRDDLLSWLGRTRCAPSTVWIAHGEPAAQDAMRRHVRDTLGWPARVPVHGQRVDIAPGG